MHSIYFSNASNLFGRRKKLQYCNARCAGGALSTSHWLILFKKHGIIPIPLPPRTFILAMHCLTSFFFFAAQWYLQSLWHYVINGYIVSHSAAEKCMHLCDRWAWIVGSMVEYTLSAAALSPLNAREQIWKCLNPCWCLWCGVHQIAHLQFYVGNRGHNHAGSLFPLVQSTVGKVALLHFRVYFD